MLLEAGPRVRALEAYVLCGELAITAVDRVDGTWALVACGVGETPHAFPRKDLQPRGRVSQWFDGLECRLAPVAHNLAACDRACLEHARPVCMAKVLTTSSLVVMFSRSPLSTSLSPVSRRGYCTVPEWLCIKSKAVLPAVASLYFFSLRIFICLYLADIVSIIQRFIQNVFEFCVRNLVSLTIFSWSAIDTVRYSILFSLLSNKTVICYM